MRLPENLASFILQTYVPLPDSGEIGSPSWARFPVAATAAPEHMCGSAHRVGYARTPGGERALYRIKCRIDPSSKAVTLPTFFVLDNGILLDYAEWQRSQEVP